ncbi:hypothetical protein NUW58_g1784 [Xylaria curta]|uniref:Uncharacterized protein n=1 Tax=Xylaria curta TaxID=42375 RepID=A0ACC1PL62_9PEZI|nr:hypothetical protein NUW58_g1784 [Xylaria curta]
MFGESSPIRRYNAMQRDSRHQLRVLYCKNNVATLMGSRELLRDAPIEMKQSCGLLFWGIKALLFLRRRNTILQLSFHRFALGLGARALASRGGGGQPLPILPVSASSRNLRGLIRDARRRTYWLLMSVMLIRGCAGLPVSFAEREHPLPFYDIMAVRLRQGCGVSEYRVSTGLRSPRFGVTRGFGQKIQRSHVGVASGQKPASQNIEIGPFYYMDGDGV